MPGGHSHFRISSMIHNHRHGIRRKISKLEKMFNFLLIFRQSFRILTSYNKSHNYDTYCMPRKMKDMKKDKEDFKEKCAKNEVLAFT